MDYKSQVQILIQNQFPHHRIPELLIYDTQRVSEYDFYTVASLYLPQQEVIQFTGEVCRGKKAAEKNVAKNVYDFLCTTTNNIETVNTTPAVRSTTATTSTTTVEPPPIPSSGSSNNNNKINKYNNITMQQ